MISSVTGLVTIAVLITKATEFGNKILDNADQVTNPALGL